MGSMLMSVAAWAPACHKPLQRGTSASAETAVCLGMLSEGSTEQPDSSAEDTETSSSPPSLSPAHVESPSGPKASRLSALTPAFTPSLAAPDYNLPGQWFF